FAGALLATAYLFDAERRDERHGGARRRRVRAKRGVLESLAAARERRRVGRGPLGALDLEGPRRWPAFCRRGEPRLALGQGRTSRRPVWLSFAQLRKHTLILGATGAGKSNTLGWIVTRALRAGDGAVVIDMKADPHLRERLAVEAGLCRKPYYEFRIEDGGGQRYNPLRHGDETARRDRLVASQVFSEDYYRGLFATHAKVVLDALAALGREPTIAALCELWDPQDLKGVVRGLGRGKDERSALVRYLDRLPHQQAEHVVSLRARLAEIADTACAARLCSGSSEADEIDLERALRRGAVVCFSLNADAYPSAAAMLASLILQDLVGIVGGLRQARVPVRCMVGVDEFGALPGDQVGRLLSTARDVGVGVVLGGQDLAQLRRVSEHFEAEVKANVCTVIAHRQSEPDSAEQIARIAGTEEVVAQTQQVDRRMLGRGRGAQTADQTGVGSQHYERQFRVGPDEIKDLETGEAVVRSSHPAGVHVVRVYRCETADEAAALAAMAASDGRTQAAGVAEVMALHSLSKSAAQNQTR
ncbi:MAG: type IV secretory system conjugative DNA transfer family protein, partial [Thermoleophilaceae bacterium]